MTIQLKTTSQLRHQILAKRWNNNYFEDFEKLPILLTMKMTFILNESWYAIRQ